MKRRTVCFGVIFGVGLGLAWVLLWFSRGGLQTVQAQGPDAYSVYYVDAGGSCGGAVPCYSSVQAAVDAVDDPADLIKVAGGIYGGVQGRPAPPDYLYPPASGVITQVVYVSKTLAIRGGYTAIDWTTPDPALYLTTLDAGGQGRVVFVTGSISPTIEGLRLTGGDAGGLQGAVFGGSDSGGGVYVNGSSGTLRDNVIWGNVAPGWDGSGGGVLLWQSDAVLRGNTIRNNTAHSGGGVHVEYGTATLEGNQVWGNNAAGGGGGMALFLGQPTVQHNEVFSNTAASDGGGILLSQDSSTLEGNRVYGNSAGWGGGLGFMYSAATLVNNVIVDNGVGALGSGVYVNASSPQLLHTTIARNTGGDGSGLYAREAYGVYSSPSLINTILSDQIVGVHVLAGNSASLDSTLWYNNGTHWSGPVTRSNDRVGDPAFVDPVSGDYHLGPASAAIDGGVDAGITVDLDGEARPSGTGYDIGADERLGASRYNLDLRVAASSDDAEERAGGWVTVTGDSLTLGDFGGNLQTVGVRFDGLAISPGMQIANAYVQFEADASWSGPAQQTIEGHADDNAPAFASGWNTITSRPRTAAAVSWSVPDWTVVGAQDLEQRTPDLSAVLQEIVDRPGWAPGNAVALIFGGIAGRRVAESYDGDPPSAPLLHVEYVHVPRFCWARINNDPTEYATVQAAVDAAVDGDLVKVAGNCSGVQARRAPPDYPYPPASGVISQVVAISKTITVQGGYTTTNWTTPDPVLYPTTLDALGQGRVLYITGAVSPTVNGLHLTGGDASGLGGTPYDDIGGGIYNLGAVTLNDSVVSASFGQGGGGIYNDGGTVTLNSSIVRNNVGWLGPGGGIRSDQGVLSLNDSTVHDNTTDGDGGGIYQYSGILTLNGSTVHDNRSGSNRGGGICTYSGALSLDDTAVRDNRADLYGGGVYIYGGIVDLNQSAIHGNTSALDGGGINVEGQGTMTLTNSTISGNVANSWGGGLKSNYGGPITAINLTIHDNSAQEGGGLFVMGSDPITLQGSILAGNTALVSGPDCIGTIHSSGHNLVGNPWDCAMAPDATDLTGVDPDLGMLIGSPGYHPLLPGSPAIDYIAHGDCTVATDQRGVSRFADLACDIGAYEYTLPGPIVSLSVVDGTPQRTAPSTIFELPLQVLAVDALGSPVEGATVTFDAPPSGPSGTFVDTGAETTTATTDGGGVATAATLTANALEGSYVVTATASGFLTPALFSLTNLGWYVTLAGDDTNSCQSPAAPCATIEGVLSKGGFQPGDKVLVASGTYTRTGAQVVLLDKSVVLSGGWDSTFTSQGGASILDGENVRRGVLLDSVVTVSMEHFVVQNGLSLDMGGGIYNHWATLTLNHSAVRNSRSTQGAGGGIMNDQGTLILNHSAVHDNAATMGGGIYNSQGTTSLTNSTISGNAGGDWGGGIRNWRGTLTAQNCTISDNTAFVGGGLYDSLSTGVTLQGSILAGNHAQDNADCYGTVHSSGHNLVGDVVSGCSLTPDGTDLIGVDPDLGVLIGSPAYHPLLLGSPAIDVMPHGACAVATDQRGAPRLADAACDIGAYEYTPPGPEDSISVFGGAPQTTPPSTDFDAPLQALVLDSVGSPVVGATVTFDAPASGPSGTFGDTGTVTTTAVTDGSGVATAATLTANALEGSYDVAASGTGVAAPALFSLGNRVWYVAPGGDDANSCQSLATPCATIYGVLAKGGFQAGDTIRVASGTYAGTMTGSQVVLLNKSATLSGGWDSAFVTQSGVSTIDGGNALRGMDVATGVTAVVERFVIQNGAGGGIRNHWATLTLDHTTVRDNRYPQGYGGGLWNEGGSLTLHSSLVHSNTAEYEAGGIYSRWGTLVLNDSTISDNVSGAPGGGISSGSTATVTNSVIRGNQGGGIKNSGTMVIAGSEVSGNRLPSGSGAGIYNSLAITLTNSTISGNLTWGFGGGIYSDSGSVTALYCTISDNTAHRGGGIYGSASVMLEGSILAGNNALDGPDCSHTVQSSGYNLVGDLSGCTYTADGTDLIDVAANLSALIGSPAYHPLLPGSPAIDYIPHGVCAVATDQRGVSRIADSACDIGAYEYTLPAPAASVMAVGRTPQSTAPWSAFEAPLQAAVLDAIGTPVSGVSVTFTAPATGASGTFADSGSVMTTAVTGLGGVATAATFTANGVESAYSVEAAATGVVSPTYLALENRGWYVAPGGDDTNDCQSAATPCASVNGALAKPSFGLGDTVLVASGTYTTVYEQVVLVDVDARLLGGWDSAFTAQSGVSTLDGEGVHHGISVGHHQIATVERFVVQNGQYGILNAGAVLVLRESVVSNNAYQGIHNDGMTTLYNSVVRDNAGTGILNDHYGTLIVTESTVSGNTASYPGGGINNYGAVTLRDSVVSGNTATEGGGIYSYARMALENTTVSGNTATDSGGGILADSFSNLSLVNCTVTRNAAGTNGGGIHNRSSMLTLQNTIVADQVAGPDCGMPLSTSGGHNLDSDGTCGLIAPGDISGTEPLLGSLQDNGGPTETHLPLPGSPVIDNGDPGVCQATGTLAVDQRGVARPQDGDADGTPRCDIGAVERLAAVRETQAIAAGDAPPVDFPTVGVTVDCSSGPGGTVTVTRHAEDYHSPPSGVGTMNRFWEISASFSPYLCDLVLRYDEADLNGAAEGDIAGAARWDWGGNRIWRYLGGTLDTSANTITIPDVPDFSSWLILTSTPPEAVADLGGTRAGSDLQLTWTAVTLDIQGNPVTPSHYVVYRRANEAYFLPTPADIVALPPTNVFTDTGVLGDPANNYYYMVTAVDGAGVESAGTRRLGAFNYALVPAAGAGERAYNLIALPLEMPTVVDADTLAAYTGPGVYMVLQHDAATQGIEWRLPGLAGTNFPAGLGSVPYLYLDDTAATELSLIGIVSPSGALGYSLERPAPGGSCTYNFISVPLHRGDLADADALAADIGGVYSVSRYNAATQDLTWRIPGVSGQNFPVQVGYPYVVCLEETGPGTWP